MLDWIVVQTNESKVSFLNFIEFLHFVGGKKSLFYFIFFTQKPWPCNDFRMRHQCGWLYVVNTIIGITPNHWTQALPMSLSRACPRHGQPVCVTSGDKQNLVPSSPSLVNSSCSFKWSPSPFSVYSSKVPSTRHEPNFSPALVQCMWCPWLRLICRLCVLPGLGPQKHRPLAGPQQLAAKFYPRIILREDQRHFYTHSLAGTRKNNTCNQGKS